MEEGESIRDLQGFPTIVNHLVLLGRSFDNIDMVHKLLMPLMNEWQLKVTTINESLKMQMPTIQMLYGNPEEQELEVKRFKNGDDKKKRSLALKATNPFEHEDEDVESYESCDSKNSMTMLSKKIKRILKEKRTKREKK